MNKDEMISEEAFNELINGFEYIESLTLYGRKNIKYHVQKLQRENEELKKQVEIKNSGFMASIEEVCQYAIVLTEFEKWLEEEIKRCNNLINPKNSLNPYGEELAILENSRNCYIYCKDRLQELKEGKK